MLPNKLRLQLSLCLLYGQTIPLNTYVYSAFKVQSPLMRRRPPLPGLGNGAIAALRGRPARLRLRSVAKPLSPSRLSYARTILHI
eukprot:6195543-Pleurochrysis_carterae.AAC.3